MDLRPYQVKAIDDARRQLAAGRKRVLLVMPTGGGKTVVASSIIHSAVEKRRRVLFVAHRRELIFQTADKLNRFGVRYGIIMGRERMALHQPVQVASIQTLLGKLELVSKFDLVFIDEAHHATSSSYEKAIAAFPGARVVGLTATPWRLDGRGLKDLFDAHVLACTPRELRDQGFLVGVGGWEYEAIDTSLARVKGGDFVVGELAVSATSRRVVGNVVAEWQQHAAGRRTVLFACTIEHSQAMVAAFRQAGVAAEHVDGEMATAERDAVLGRLRRGETLVVSNCNVLTEGFDCPELEVALLCRPTLSTALYLQMVGRVLRPAPGKPMARLHDHAGCLAAHGHPYADRDYSPELTSRAKREDAEKAITPEKRCRACKSVIARWPCDACGYSPTPKELQLEVEEAAHRREITNDGRAPSRPKDSDEDRRRRWLKDWSWDDDRKRRFLEKMVFKHGRHKGARVYHWFSGFAEHAPREWLDQIEGATAA